MTIETKKNIFISGIFLLAFILINILISTSLFIFDISIKKYYPIIAYLITIIITLILMKKMKTIGKKFGGGIITIIIPTLIITLSIFLSGKIYDMSWDGNDYHKTTIGFLKDGWNPLYENCEEFAKTQKLEVPTENNHLWVDHYARATHIYQANIYALTNNIETGKSINTITIIAVFLILFSLLSIYFNTLIFPLIFSIVASSCPVACVQFLTTYIDLHVYLYLLLLLVSFFAIEYKKENIQTLGLILYIISLLMMINIKFTSFAYAGIFCLGYYIYYIIKLIKEKNNKKFFITFTVASAICLIVGLFIIGLAIYPKNFKDHNHPFYPLFGEEKVDIMIHNSPYYFEKKSPIEKYFISMFSKVDNISRSSKKEAEYKIPFTIHKSELDYYSTYDARISGNGIWFSGIFIISIIVISYSLPKIYKSNRKIFILTIIPIITTVTLIFTLNEAWWARYFPQTYILILISILYLYILKNKISKTVLSILISIIFINNFSIFMDVLKTQYNHTITTNKEIEQIQNLINPKNEKLVIMPRNFGGTLYNIKEKFKNYEIEIVPTTSLDGYTYAMNGFICWKKEEK